VIGDAPAKRLVRAVGGVWILLEDGRLFWWRPSGSPREYFVPSPRPAGEFARGVVDFDGFHALMADGTFAELLGNHKLAKAEGPGGARAIAFALRSQLCAIRQDWTVACRTDRDGPLHPVGVDDVVALESGWNEACALRKNGDLVCWEEEGAPAVRATEVRQFVLDHRLGCAVKRDGEVLCWGNHRIPELHGALALHANVHGGCAVLKGGDVSCWGDAKRWHGAAWLRELRAFGACAVLRDGRAVCWDTGT
jgi:hypothetical protein